jgi:DNA modification methylase
MKKKINLMHGDCLELMKSIPDKSIDLVLTDPPYGTTACKWDTVIPFEPMWKELKRIRKDNAAIVLFGSEPFSTHLRMSNIKEFKYDWIWDKVLPSGMAFARFQPMRQHELISVFAEKRTKYYPQMVLRDKPVKSGGLPITEIYGKGLYQKAPGKTYTHKFPRTFLKEMKCHAKCPLHPTQKPIALLEYLIKTYTLEGETVLDFTMGSGSTGVAAKNLNRKFIGIEKDLTYYDIATKRIYETLVVKG